MNVNQIIQLVKDIASVQTGVNSVYDGDVYENWNSAETKYGSFNIGLENATYDSQNITYTVVLYYGDRLLQDNSNSNDLYTDGIRVLQSIINKLRTIDGIGVNLGVDEEIEYSFINQGFLKDDNGNFVDIIGGAYTRINIYCPSELGLCYMDEYDWHDERDELIRRLEERIRQLEIDDAILKQILLQIRYKLNGTPIEED